MPASLRSNTVACCTEIVPRIWANTSPGAHQLVVDAEAGPDVAVDELLDRRRAQAAGHLARRREGRRTRPRTRRRRGRRRRTASSARARRRRRAAAPTAARPPGSTEPQPPWAWIRSPSSRARPHSSATPSGSPAAGTTDPNASVVVGPRLRPDARSRSGSVGGTGSPSRVSRRAAYTNTVRSPESACACSAASASRVVGAGVEPVHDGRDPGLDAPSRPISVAAYTSSDV